MIGGIEIYYYHPIGVKGGWEHDLCTRLSLLPVPTVKPKWLATPWPAASYHPTPTLSAVCTRSWAHLVVIIVLT